MNTPLPTHTYTGWHCGLFYVQGTMSKRLCEAMEAQGLLKFPSSAHRNYSLANGPRPQSAFDALPDDSAETPTP